MILGKNVQSRRLLRLVFVGMLVVVVAFGVLSSSGALGAGAQPSLGQGTLYLTKADSTPDGAIVTPLDFQLGLFQTVVTGLNYPDTILCGPDGRLYITDTLYLASGGRIQRFNQDGSGRTLILQVAARTYGLVFAPNGDLYFGTHQEEGSQGSQGVWRIPGVLRSDREFAFPQQVLAPTGNNAGIDGPSAFFTTGPFKGDLLVVEIPKEGASGRVLRAIAPDFASVKEFIPAHDDAETGRPFEVGGLAVNSQGDIFLTDFEKGKVLRYESDGTFKGVFAKVVFPNQIAIGPDDLVYVTNAHFSSNGADRGGIFIFDPQGKQLAPAAIAPMHLRGVTVCAPK